MLLIKPDPWFQPLYRRVIITTVCAGWLVFEMVIDDPLGIWGMLAIAVTVIAVWSFFLAGDYKKKVTAEDNPDEPAE